MPSNPHEPPMWPTTIIHLLCWRLFLTPPEPPEETAGPTGTHFPLPICPLEHLQKSPQDDCSHQYSWREASQEDPPPHCMPTLLSQSCCQKEDGDFNTKKGSRSRGNDPHSLKALSWLLTHPAGSCYLCGWCCLYRHPHCCPSHSGYLKERALETSSELTSSPCQGSWSCWQAEGISPLWIWVEFSTIITP